jgi:hypothetical protein
MDWIAWDVLRQGVDGILGSEYLLGAEPPKILFLSSTSPTIFRLLSPGEKPEDIV